MCRTAVDAEALWKRPTKPISSKVPYYLFSLFFFLLVVVSIASLVEIHGLLQQARNDLVVWSEAHQEKWAMFSRSLRKEKKNPCLIRSQSQGCPEGNLYTGLSKYPGFKLFMQPWPKRGNMQSYQPDTLVYSRQDAFVITASNVVCTKKVNFEWMKANPNSTCIVGRGCCDWYL